MRAEEFMKALDEMDNAERIKLLSWLFDKYFDNRPLVKLFLIKEGVPVLFGTPSLPLLYFKIIMSVKLTPRIKRCMAAWATIVACHILFNR